MLCKGRVQGDLHKKVAIVPPSTCNLTVHVSVNVMRAGIRSNKFRGKREADLDLQLPHSMGRGSDWVLGVGRAWICRKLYEPRKRKEAETLRGSVCRGGAEEQREQVEGLRCRLRS